MPNLLPVIQSIGPRADYTPQRPVLLHLQCSWRVYFLLRRSLPGRAPAFNGDASRFASVALFYSLIDRLALFIILRARKEELSSAIFDYQPLLLSLQFKRFCFFTVVVDLNLAAQGRLEQSMRFVENKNALHQEG
jgi:hypothetical protein